MQFICLLNKELYVPDFYQLENKHIRLLFGRKIGNDGKITHPLCTEIFLFEDHSSIFSTHMRNKFLSINNNKCDNIFPL